ncbi:hypothetical protein D9611_012994 [Ephemerocybe angulata]|uniref:Uncharacterized protein n=1 Tax=Ephemerocybe angulata TaxID=980116 RepID=A0A8H5ET89_9AGAR|nr:hypothetical protein D9611_012994 [Tulosesus angulatus]
MTSITRISSRIIGPKDDLCPGDIEETILSYLPLQDLQAMSLVSPGSPVVVGHLRGRVTRLLAALGLDPIQILDIMRETGAIISGSFALEIVNPGSCTPRDLNLYCGLGKGERVGALLGALQGIEPKQRCSADSTLPPSHVLNIDHPYRIDFTIRPRTHLLFHNTVLMNCVTGHEVICFYPQLTRDYVGLQNLRSVRSGTHDPEWVQRWDCLGYSVASNCGEQHQDHVYWSAQPSHGSCHHEYRNTSDALSARVAFTYDAPISDDSVPVLCWRLGFDLQGYNVTLQNSPAVFLFTADWSSERMKREAARDGAVIWNTYTAPLLADKLTIDPRLWKRCFP